MLRHALLALFCLYACLTGTAQSNPANDSALQAVLSQMQYSSAALKTAGGELDSAKVYDFMARYNPVYGQRDAYRLELMRLIHSTITKSEDNYYLYDSLLLVIPNNLLQNSYPDLFNKLQTGRVLHPDTGYALTVMLNKADPRGFKSWLQDAFWQQFHAPPTPREAQEMETMFHQRGVSERRLQQFKSWEAHAHPGYPDSLLEKMVKDNDLHNFVYPMALWRHLHDHPADTALQASTVKAFSQMDANTALLGYAQRYALVCYQLLQEQHASALADTLLTHTMRRLQQEATDSDNPNLHAAQSMLAYAWYMRYKAAKDTAPAQALEYLANAAGLGPRDATEKSYVSFYDRAILGDDAKESYRGEFAKALLEKGNDKTAIRIMAEQINASPEEAYEFKTLFESKFPKGDFNSFFNAHVIGAWKMAPDFRLRTPDGKYKQLSDYKGKWLLIDFWGTWCPPCRQELPSLNAFANSIAQDPTQAFLSIDCRDQQSSLTSFLASNRYSFPVVMADEKVEKDYAITGYPSKFLVTPDGRMLPLAFGAPWQSILSQFVAIQRDAKRPATKPKVHTGNKAIQ